MKGAAIYENGNRMGEGALRCGSLTNPALLCYNRIMKKFVAALLLLVLMLAVSLGSCKDKTGEFPNYFNNFASTDPYRKAEVSLTLPEGVQVASYDAESDVFITAYHIYDPDADEEEEDPEPLYTVYGLCSDTEVYLAPRYAGILDIFGDYAIVVRFMIQGAELESKVGLVKFRGEDSGWEWGFSYDYAPLITQMQFLDDRYFVMLGDGETEVTDPGYATVYDYRSGRRPLKVAHIPEVANGTAFYCFDQSYLVTAQKNTVTFYDFNRIEKGSFVRTDRYSPFNADDGLSSSGVSTSVYYLGNHWFILSGTYSSNSEFAGYDIAKPDEDDPDTVTYLKIRSVRYNILSGQTYTTDRVVLVANPYTDNYIRTMTDALNSSYTNEGFKEADGIARPLYAQPVVPTSSVAKGEYSIVYYYYYYYIEDEIVWDVSFALYNRDANAKLIESLAMPLVYVDGKGYMSADPEFSIPARNASYYDLQDNEVVVRALESKVGYDPVAIHSGMMIAYEYNLNNYTQMAGAFNLETDSIAVPFEYYELTIFVGDYATGSKLDMVEDPDDPDKTLPLRTFYRIGKNGAATELQNVYSLRNGVYTTLIKDKGYGLYANDGTQLIPERCEVLSVVETFLQDGVFMKTHVITVENGRGVIYRLS